MITRLLGRQSETQINLADHINIPKSGYRSICNDDWMIYSGHMILHQHQGDVWVLSHMLGPNANGEARSEVGLRNT